jgi:regulator of sigma E protease
MSLDTLLDLGLFALILMFLILVHELGHMIVAKRSGMKVERFSIFFGRPLASFRRGETEYGIGWIPLGGYVKITGMTREEEVAPEDVPRTYYNASTGRRVATIFAGPAVNIVVAFLAFAAIAWIGPPSFDVTNEVAGVVETYEVDGQTLPTPAAELGLREGDVLLAINSVPASPEDVEAIRSEIQQNAGREIEVAYERDGERVTGLATPAILVEGGETGQLGFNFTVVEGPVERAGPMEGVADGGRALWFMTEAYGDLAKEIFVSEEAREQVNSVVGAGAIFDVVADNGFITILAFLGAISFALGVFNLLPILPLDGGHIVIALTERVIGRPLSGRAYQAMALVGIAVVMVAFLYILQNDVELIRGGNIAERLAEP